MNILMILLIMLLYLGVIYLILHISEKILHSLLGWCYSICLLGFPVSCKSRCSNDLCFGMWILNFFRHVFCMLYFRCTCLFSSRLKHKIKTPVEEGLGALISYIHSLAGSLTFPILYVKIVINKFGILILLIFFEGL